MCDVQAGVRAQQGPPIDVNKREVNCKQEKPWRAVLVVSLSSHSVPAHVLLGRIGSN